MTINHICCLVIIVLSCACCLARVIRCSPAQDRDTCRVTLEPMTASQQAVDGPHQHRPYNGFESFAVNAACPEQRADATSPCLMPLLVQSSFLHLLTLPCIHQQLPSSSHMAHHSTPSQGTSGAQAAACPVDTTLPVWAGAPAQLPLYHAPGSHHRRRATCRACRCSRAGQLPPGDLLMADILTHWLCTTSLMLAQAGCLISLRKPAGTCLQSHTSALQQCARRDPSSDYHPS
jgi:hypothetical protein